MASDDWYMAQIDESPFIKEGSKNTYKTNMRSILARTKAGSVDNLLRHPEKYSSLIGDNRVPMNTQYSHFTTVLTFLNYSGLKAKDKPLYQKWYIVFEKVREVVKEAEASNLPSAKQSRNHIHWSDVLRARGGLEVGSPEHVLLSFYTYVPPRRQLDYTNMIIYTNKKEAPPLDHNQFHLYCEKYSSAYMFINEFKNSKFYKSFFNKEIPPELVHTLRVSLQKQPRGWVFVEVDGQPFKTANSFQKYSNRILKRVFNNPEMSVNVLRHSFSTYLSEVPNMTVKERQRHAIKMGHSLKKSLEYAFIKQDPPMSMMEPDSKEECYKKDITTKKLVKIVCPQ